MNFKKKSMIIIAVCLLTVISIIAFVVSCPLAALCFIIGVICGFTADLDILRQIWSEVQDSFSEVFNFNEGN